jgi:hypothetical protein
MIHWKNSASWCRLRTAFGSSFLFYGFFYRFIRWIRSGVIREVFEINAFHKTLKEVVFFSDLMFDRGVQGD